MARWCRCTRFLDGDLASKARIGDLTGFATTLARFLNALGRVDATGGPEPGQHNFFRGGALATYEHETLKAIDALVDEVPSDDVKRVWADAMATSCGREPVWFHGDVATGNLRIRDERLAAVLDFGSSGVGDPRLRHRHRLDVPVGSNRNRFRVELDVDSGTRSRGRGWALWKALISLVGHLEGDAPEAAVARRDIDQILADYAQDRSRGLGRRRQHADPASHARRAAAESSRWGRRRRLRGRRRCSLTPRKRVQPARIHGVPAAGQGRPGQRVAPLLVLTSRLLD